MDSVVAVSLQLPARVWRQLRHGMLTAPVLAAGELTAPTFILLGAEDAVFGREQQARLLELIPRARMAVYDGVGHAPHWEDPERFTADLVSFLGDALPDF